MTLNKNINEEDIWYALSDLFIDTEIDNRYIAKQIYTYPLDELRHIFFNKIAPIYGGVYLTPVPPVWTAYDRDAFIASIENHIEKMHSSHLYRFKVKLSTRFFRYILKDAWQELELEVVKLQQNSISTT